MPLVNFDRLRQAFARLGAAPHPVQTVTPQMAQKLNHPQFVQRGLQTPVQRQQFNQSLYRAQQMNQHNDGLGNLASVAANKVDTLGRGILQQGFIQPGMEVAQSIRQKVTGKKSQYTPGSPQAKFIFGDKPIQSLQYNHATTEKGLQHSGNSLVRHLATPLSYANTALHIANDVPVVGTALKAGVKGTAKVAPELAKLAEKTAPKLAPALKATGQTAAKIGQTLDKGAVATAKATGKAVKASNAKVNTNNSLDAGIKWELKQQKAIKAKMNNVPLGSAGGKTTSELMGHLDQSRARVNQMLNSKQKLSLKDKVLTARLGLSMQDVSKQQIAAGSDGSLAKNTPKMSIPGDALSSGNRQRGLSTTIQNDLNTPDAVKRGVRELYKVRNTKDLQSRAANLVKDNPNLAMRVFKSDSNSDVGTMIGGELSAHLSRTGQHEAATEVALQMSREATNRGQANQALSAWGKLAPESILRFTQTTVNQYNKAAKLLGTNKELKLSPEQASKISGMSEQLQNMPTGRAKDIATQKLLNEVKQVIPSSWVKKLSTTQTIGQLLNPKTFIRNIGGNTMFSGLENVSQTLAAGIDKTVSVARGSARKVALPNLKTQAKSAVKGAKQQYSETKQGINLGPETQYDLNNVPTFRSGAMAKIEKTMGVALRVPDRAAFQAAYDDTVQGLMKANKLDKPTQSILDQAEAQGLYRTFQDNSKAAELFTKLKSALNTVGVTGKDGSRFGLGDMILKYPKTPGNILARGVDYSPGGIVKGLYQIVKPALTGQPFDQASFANNIARGTVGTTGLVGSGAVLGALGIITEKPSQDADTRNLQKASGQGGYQINTSALKRFFLGGFNKNDAKLRQGDTLVSYDWAQPASIPLSAGAALGKGKSAMDGATSTLDNAASGLNSLVEQPLVTGINTFANNIKNYGLVGAGTKVLQGAPASFVPTASNQVRQLTDNNTRNTYDPSAKQTTINMVKNKIPFVDKSLPNKVGALGENLQNYQNGSNNLFNVAVNPAFVNKYQPNDSANLPLDILNRSGNTKQIPTTTKPSQNVNGTNVKLTATQNHDFQQFVGQTTKQAIDLRRKDPVFMALSDQEQANELSNTISNIQAAAKVKLLGDTPSKTQSKAVDKVLTGNLVYTPKKTTTAKKVKVATLKSPKATKSSVKVAKATKATKVTSRMPRLSIAKPKAFKLNVGSPKSAKRKGYKLIASVSKQKKIKLKAA